MDEIPRDRAEAQVLANRVGVAYYADKTNYGRKSIFRVSRDTPIDNEGELVVRCSALTNPERDAVVKGLNNAYQGGRENGVTTTCRDIIRKEIDEAMKPLADRLEDHMAAKVRSDAE